MSIFNWFKKRKFKKLNNIKISSQFYDEVNEEGYVQTFYAMRILKRLTLAVVCVIFGLVAGFIYLLL